MVQKRRQAGDAVDRGRLVEIFRHRHEARQHQQHDEGRPHPGIGEDDARHGAGLAVHQDELAVGDAVDHVAEDAEGRVIVVGEEHARGDDRQHHRRQHQDQQVLAQRELLGEQHRQQEADEHLRRHREHHEHRGIDEGVPVGRRGDVVGQHLDVVVEADEADRLLVRLVGEERQPQRPQQRKDVHHEQHGDRRRDQQAAVIAAAVGIHHEGRGDQRRHGADDPEGDGRRQGRHRERGDDEADENGEPPIVGGNLEQSRRGLGRWCA